MVMPGDGRRSATRMNAHVALACEDCRHRVEVAAAELMRQGQIPPDTLFRTIAQRLACGACGLIRVGIRAASHNPYRDRR